MSFTYSSIETDFRIAGNFIHNIILTNPKETNGAVLYYLAIGNQADDQLRTRLLLVDHLLKDPTFSVLRTKEQLGYMVQSMIRVRSSALGFVIRIQSERHPAYVERRIEAFLESYRSEITSMSFEEFSKQRKGLVHKQRQRLENLTEESSRFWHHIQSGYHDFTRREPS
jgi:insulysin